MRCVDVLQKKISQHQKLSDKKFIIEIEFICVLVRGVDTNDFYLLKKIFKFILKLNKKHHKVHKMNKNHHSVHTSLMYVSISLNK